MEEKKIDNTIISNKKKMLEDYDFQINENKKSIEQIEDLQEHLYLINKKLNKCAELVNKSVINKKVNRMFDSYQTENKIEFDKVIYVLDEKKETKIKENNDLRHKSDELMNEMRNEAQKEAHKEAFIDDKKEEISE